MRIKTSEASGEVLDYLVAVAEGHQWRCSWMLQKEGYFAWIGYERAWGNPHPDYSTDWAQGGPIIEREKIDLYYSTKAGLWAAAIWQDMPGGGQLEAKVKQNPTPLVAAMRCFVTRKLGDEVDVPEELLQ